MKTAQIALLACFLCALCNKAEAYDYPNPLWDSPNITEAMWDMNGTGTILGENRQPLTVVPDDNSANRWRHQDLVLYGGQLVDSHHGNFGKSLYFDGVGNGAFAYSRSFQDRGGVVVELWVKIAPTQNPGAVYLASAYDAWQLYLTNNGGTANFQVFDPRGGNTAINVPIAKNTWQHIRAEFYKNSLSQGALTLEVSDGTTASAHIASGTAAYNKLHVENRQVYLGADPGWGGKYTGEIDDVRITAQSAPTARARGIEMVETFYLDIDPNAFPKTDPNTGKVVDQAGSLATWCLAALWLYTLPASDHTIVTMADKNVALSKLASFAPVSPYPTIPVTRPIDERTIADIYWGQLSLVRMLNNPSIYLTLDYPALNSIHEVLWNFVRERDIAATEADLTEGALWSVYWSMNHDWMTKATYLLTAQYYMQHHINKIYADGLDANQHYDRWVWHLKAKMRQMAARGIDPEIASPAYLAITLDALYAIRDYVADPDLRQQTEKFIDLIMADAAAESFHGVRGGGKSRSYKSFQSIDADSDYLGLFTHVLVNDPVIIPGGNVSRHLVGFAMTDHVLPAVTGNLMLSGNKSVDHASRRPARGTYDEYTRTNMVPFYHFVFPSEIRRATFGTPEYILGSFALTDQMDPRYYSDLTQVDQWMGLITSGWRYSRAYFQVGSNENDPSTYYSMTAIQWPGDPSKMPGECAMLIKRARLSDNPDFFFWMSDDFRANMVGPDASTGNWIFSQNRDGTTYIGIKAIAATSPSAYRISYPSDPARHGTDARVDLADPSQIIAMEVAPRNPNLSFQAFQNSVKMNAMQSSGGFNSYTSSGGMTLTMDASGAPSTVNGSIYPGNINKTYAGNYLTNSVYDDPVITIRDQNLVSANLDFRYTGYSLAPDWKERSYEDFEKIVNGYSCRTDGAPANAHQGNGFTGTTRSCDLDGQSGTSFVSLNKSMDLATPGYTQLKVEFWYRPVGMETGKKFALMVNDNGPLGWRTVQVFTSTNFPSSSQFMNGDFRYVNCIINRSDLGGFSTNFRIGFQNYGSDASDHVYIDQVKISARVL